MATRPADLERIERYGAATAEYTVATITDEDQASQVELADGQIAWQSTVRYHRLYREVDERTGQVGYRLEPIAPEQGGEGRLTSLIAEGGRGAEFSELTWFGGRLLAFDDRTGLVCEVRGAHHLVPRHILMTGSGDERFKGFKAEWATLCGDQLIVGSHGKKPEESWIKSVGRGYQLASHDWQARYAAIRKALGVSEAGYVIHEAAEWHPYRQQWYFFPRKISSEAFDEARDERECGGHTLIVADEHFDHIRSLPVGERVPERGVSSFKILPGHPDECIGLKSVEIDDSTETYLFCFDLEGNVLKDDTFLGSYKCEGVEIL
jgi:soluble calcium-activated nucleotidase 1